MVAAGTTQRSRSPAPNNGRRGDKRALLPAPKVSRPDFYSFQNPGNGICKFHYYSRSQKKSASKKKSETLLFIITRGI